MKRLKTALAQELNAEFQTVKYKLDEDTAALIAEGVDNGVLKDQQARMMAALAADWQDSALLDASTTMRELHKTTATETFNLEDNVLINQMKEAHGLLDDGSQDNVLLQDMKERIAADAF